jgi:putative transposase
MSRECPQCGSTDRTTQHRGALTCPYGFEGHTDLTASKTFFTRIEARMPLPQGATIGSE